jgi:hypothetical protein
MADLQELIRAVDELGAEELKRLYLHIVETRVQFSDTQPDTLERPVKARVLGLHAHLGKAWLSDDFNAELPDSFWLGES